MNGTIKNEQAVTVQGVAARAFAVVAADNGRILNQTIKASRQINAHERLTVKMRFDDECRNGHETFAITATLYDSRVKQDHGIVACGCLHEDIAKVFPEFARFIKWHLVSTDGPMYYVANTLYHADEHGPTHAWVYFTDDDPQHIGGRGERLLRYAPRAEAVRAEGKPGYRVEWDQKTVKTRNLDYARSSAVWPDATDAELTIDRHSLKIALERRLPALMREFKKDMREIGFVWPEITEKVECHA